MEVKIFYFNIKSFEISALLSLPSGLNWTSRLNVFPVCRKNLAAISSVAVLMFIPQILKFNNWHN